MGASLFWGAVSASSLLIGAVLGVIRPWNAKALGLVLGFGAGALISGIAFQLSAGGFQAAGPWPLTIGLAAGALVFFFADRFVEAVALRSAAWRDCRWPSAGCWTAFPNRRSSASTCPTATASHSPSSWRSSSRTCRSRSGRPTQMHQGGKSTRYVLLLWLAVTLVCVLSTWLGYLAASVTRGRFEGLVDGFAAGALLVMLVGAMIPEAQKNAGRVAGLAAVLGFAVASGLAVAS